MVVITPPPQIYWQRQGNTVVHENDILRKNIEVQFIIYPTFGRRKAQKLKPGQLFLCMLTVHISTNSQQTVFSCRREINCLVQKHITDKLKRPSAFLVRIWGESAAFSQIRSKKVQDPVLKLHSEAYDTSSGK